MEFLLKTRTYCVKESTNCNYRTERSKPVQASSGDFPSSDRVTNFDFFWYSEPIAVISKIQLIIQAVTQNNKHRKTSGKMLPAGA